MGSCLTNSSPKIQTKESICSLLVRIHFQIMQLFGAGDILQVHDPLIFRSEELGPPVTTLWAAVTTLSSIMTSQYDVTDCDIYRSELHTDVTI